MTHICVSQLTITASDNGLSSGRRLAIIWTNAGILLIGSLRTNCSAILIMIYTFLLKKMHLKMSSRKWLPFCLGLNVIILNILKIFILFFFFLNCINIWINQSDQRPNAFSEKWYTWRIWPLPRINRYNSWQHMPDPVVSHITLSEHICAQYRGL